MVIFQFAKCNKLLELLEGKWWRPCTKTWKPLSDELIEGIIPNKSHLPGMIWVKDREPTNMTNMFKICKSACTADLPSKKNCFSMATLRYGAIPKRYQIQRKLSGECLTCQRCKHNLLLFYIFILFVAHPTNRVRRLVQPNKWINPTTCPTGKTRVNQPGIAYLGFVASWPHQGKRPEMQVDSSLKPRCWKHAAASKLGWGWHRGWRWSGWWFGTMEFYDFPFSWECHHPNWRTHIFQISHQPVMVPEVLNEVAKYTTVVLGFCWISRYMELGGCKPRAPPCRLRYPEFSLVWLPVGMGGGSLYHLMLQT